MTGTSSAGCRCAACTGAPSLVHGPADCTCDTPVAGTAFAPCALPPPVIEARDAARIAQALAANRAGYVPEWTAAGDAGSALMRIAARYLEIQADGLNAMPQRLQLDFLQSLGANVLPAQPARAPLVFTLLPTASTDATVAAGTRVAAVLPPPAPSLDGGATPAPAAPEYFTEQEFTAMRGSLAALYSIDPEADAYADHLAAAAAGFAVFDAMAPVPHRLYLGHGEFFRLSGPAQIVLTVDFAPARGGKDGAPPRPLLLDWEYLGTDGWQPLLLIDDATERFTRDGRITLSKSYGPDAGQDTVAGHASCWIRATVSSRVPGARIAASGTTTDAKGRVVIAVESSREFLPGDIVTIDGGTRATVAGTGDGRVLLDAALPRVVAGDYLTLADALPPLRPDGADAAGALPEIDVVRARVGFSKNGLAPDKALLDGARLDISKDFHPFGEQPAPFAAFYIACQEAFSRPGARVEIGIVFTRPGVAGAPLAMKVEYFNGSRWAALGPNEELKDPSQGLTAAPDIDPGTGRPMATLSFAAPPDWTATAINADTRLWLRLRLAGGDYGQPISVSVTPDPSDPTRYVVGSTPSTLMPPIVARLDINYRYFTNPQPLDFCVAENDFAFTEHSEDARWPRRPFAPFRPVSDLTPALHFGFDAQPPASLVSLLAQVSAPAADGDPQPYAWDYWGARGWTELSVRDTTLGLRQTGLIQFVGAPDAVPREGLGGALYRIRARLKSGLASQDHVASLGGVWLNAAWAAQGQRVSRDTLGISNGNPDQTFVLPIVRAAGAQVGAPAAMDAAGFDRALDTALPGVAVLVGELVEVREWTGRGDDWQTAVAGVPAADLRFETDPKDPTIATAVWVRWWPQPHFYRSGPDDRHYVVERAEGVFRFPGTAGFIPPAGCPIVASYTTGGGVAGNVPAGTIRELRSGVGFVQSVTNPIAAEGGAAAELLRGARDRGVQAIRNRDRAVSAEDFEWLARSASSEVARARALPLAGPDGTGSRGFVGLVLIPHSQEAMPQPSAGLRDTVRAYLARRMPAGVADGLQIASPSYVRVGVRAEILPLVADDAGLVEARVRGRLAAFLHPLSGGRDGRGWDFGAAVWLSDLAALIEDTEGVDAVRLLQLMVGDTVYGDTVPVGPQQLIAAGDSQLKLIVPSVPYALA
ncbi:MAG: putative baseplate assembly protein [Burkholderiaceae bacterium]